MSAELPGAIPLATGWTCRGCTPDAARTPSELDTLDLRAYPASVPGTAAAAVRALDGDASARAIDYDALDWWWTTTVDVPSSGPWRLRLAGLATVGEVWVDGVLVASSESMFRAVMFDLDLTAGRHDLALRCAALAPLLEQKRPRPRWRTALVAPQSLRWFRTSALGRMPALAPDLAIVGPWRDVTLEPLAAPRVVRRHLTTAVLDGDGAVDVRLDLHRTDPGTTTAVVRVGSSSAEVTVTGTDPEVGVAMRIPDVALWWPHGYGDQPLHAVSVEVDGVALPLGRIGFRTVELDDPTGRLALRVNGSPAFARGACWVAPDVANPLGDDEATRAQLRRLRDGGATMVRVTGTMTYEGAAFFDACDELGLLVWHDVMLATLDPPDDDVWLADLAAEVREQFGALQGRPCLAVVSGGSETEQQPTLLGLDSDRRHVRALVDTIPSALADVLPGTAYVTSSPSGGDLPTHASSGVAHWFGVGGYLRPFEDTRRAGVRFAAECLAFATPPEAASLRRLMLTPGSDDWAAGTPRDNGADWDFEDVRDHYVGMLFDVDPVRLRDQDPDRWLDLGRAAVAAASIAVMTEWRRPGSGCSGGLVLHARDLLPGPGWGLLDVTGSPKAPWFALRRVWAPVALLATDEGLDGLALHVVNDAPEPLVADLEVRLVDALGRTSETAVLPVRVNAREGISTSVDAIVGGFRDVLHAFRFGPAAYDAVVARLLDADGSVLSEVVHLVGGEARPQLDDVGLTAIARQRDGAWVLDVSTRALAQWVAIDLEDHEPGDSWFHLAPGSSTVIELTGGIEPPSGLVRALNSREIAPVSVEAS